MKKHLFISIILTFGFLANVHANETYTYTGNDFNTFVVSAHGVSQAYNNRDHITFSFTTSSALSANSSLNTVSNYTNIPSIISWSFSDGLQTITNTNDPSFQYFHLGTNASGNISSWEIALLPVNASNHFLMGMLISPNNGVSGCVPGVGSCAGVQDYAFTGNATYSFAGASTAGHWSSAVSVPEPAIWLSMLLGLPAIVTTAKRRV